MPEHVQVQLNTPNDFSPGKQTLVEIQMTHDKGWHTYGPAEIGSTTIDWTLPEGWSTGEIIWPNQKNFIIQGVSSWGYSNTIKLLVPIRVSSWAKIGQKVDLTAKISWIMCGDGMCIPGEKTLTAPIKVGALGGTPIVAMAKRVMMLDWKIVVAAFVGGLILNLMPCVFPVLGVKILSFMKQGGENRAAVVSHALAYAFGIILSACALGIVIVLLRQSGMAIGWGFQLQDARLVWVIVAALMLLAMNMAGGWTLPALACDAAAEASKRHSFWGALTSGALMVLVATPCSAPFLGLAIGSVFALPALQAIFVMTMMGIGMALPYWLLALWPSALKHLPKPGEWMEDLKKILAWVMAAAALYEAWVYVGQVSPEESLRGLMGLLILLAGVWATFHWKYLGRLLGLTFILYGAWMGLNKTTNELAWEAWNPQRVAQLRQEGRTVVVDFTARWCVNCLINDKVVWGNKNVQEFVHDNNVALLKADWTKRDAQIANEIQRHGKAAVPLLIIYKKGKTDDGLALPNLLSAEEVINALK